MEEMSIAHTKKKRHSKFKYTTANFLGIDIYSDEEHNFKAVEKTIRYQKSTQYALMSIHFCYTFERHKKESQETETPIGYLKHHKRNWLPVRKNNAQIETVLMLLQT